MGAAMMGAGMGANFLSGQLQGWASLIDKWAMADAYNAELARQGQFQQQAGSVFNQQLPGAGASGASAQLADAAKTRTANYGAINNVPLGLPLSYQNSASAARDQAAVGMSAQQRAQLMAYGDWLQNQKVANMQTGRSLDQISNFAGGTASVFPYRMYDAQHAGDAWAEVGAAIGAVNSGAQGVRASFGNGPPTSSAAQAQFGYTPYGTTLMYGNSPYTPSPGSPGGYYNQYGNWQVGIDPNYGGGDVPG